MCVLSVFVHYLRESIILLKTGFQNKTTFVKEIRNVTNDSSVDLMLLRDDFEQCF